MVRFNKIQGIGVGLRQPHYAIFLSEDRPVIPWLEIVSDNYMFTHGLLREKILKIREYYPMVMHSVGLNVGSTSGINSEYLAKLKQLADDVEPAWLSDHLCWTAVDGVNSHDLLPLPFTQEALDIVVNNIQTIQDHLQRPFLIENVSSYVQFSDADFSEAEFLNEVARRSGCYILLDINNIYVNSKNHDFSTDNYLAAINKEPVKQFHLAGFEEIQNILVDTHGAAVHEPVWELYQKALQRFGAVPALIEWDNNIPGWSTMLEQVKIAQELQQRIVGAVDEAP
ncbi:MAG: DUF692 domain-containing protein [Gammaproteobacteria bacterium]|nr:DUF692 domain-containing protein [Gammaproteobacteria bacterium]